MNDYVEALRDLVNGVNPAIDLSVILKNHNCQYMLSLFDEIGQKSTQKIEHIVNHILLATSYKESSVIFDSLKRFEIPYAVIKGAVLSQMSYGHPAYRISNDIDILIERRNIKNIKEILLKNGFTQSRIENNDLVPYTREEIVYQASSSHQIAPFLKKIDNPMCKYINIDVNFDIMWGESEKKLDIGSVLSKTQEYNLFGITFNKLCPEVEFLSLCLHHYKDMNSIFMLYNNRLKISLFSDIFYYIKNVKVDFEELKKIADCFDASKYIYYCIYYTDLLFDAIETKPLIKLFYTQDGQDLLNSYGLSNDERKIWNLSFFERLFSDDITAYLEEQLSPQDKLKISVNSMYM